MNIFILKKYFKTYMWIISSGFLGSKLTWWSFLYLFKRLFKNWLLVEIFIFLLIRSWVIFFLLIQSLYRYLNWLLDFQGCWFQENIYNEMLIMYIKEFLSILQPYLHLIIFVMAQNHRIKILIVFQYKFIYLISKYWY